MPTTVVPMDISSDGPVRFRMSGGSVQAFPHYEILDEEDGPTVSYMHGCVRGEIRFTAHATLEAIYAAIVENERKFRK